MRAHISALVALDALGFIPMRNQYGSAALLVLGRTKLPLTICVVSKGRYGQGIAIHKVDGGKQFLYLLYNGLTALKAQVAGLITCVCPIRRNIKLVECGSASINSLPVSFDDSLALLSIALLGSILHVLQSIGSRQNVCQRKECGLQYGVGALAHANLGSKISCINEVDRNVVLGNIALSICWEVLVKLLITPLAVKQEGAARLNVTDHLEALNDVAGVMTSNKVCLGYIVRRANRCITKAQVRNGYATRLFGVILEVGLYVLVGMVTNDLDGVLVCANGTVATKTPELALNSTLCGRIRSIRIHGQGQVGNVIHNANRKLTLRCVFFKLFIDGEGCRRGLILGTQTIAATHNNKFSLASLIQGRDYILIQRLTNGTRLFGTIQNRNLFNACRKRGNKIFDRPRTI